MADSDFSYLKRRRKTWYFQIAIPAELRGKEPYGNKAIIVETLETRDPSEAQRKRNKLVDDYKQAFAKAAGHIQLTREEIDNIAFDIRVATSRTLEAKCPTAEPEDETETPEEAGLK